MKKIAGVILIAVLMLAPNNVVAEDVPQDKPAAASVALPVAPAKPAEISSEKPKESGIAASEALPGNGSRAGYVLGHGNIIPDSEWVYIGVKRGRKNVDYSIDYASGTLFFTEPVRQSDTVRVDYQYEQKAQGARNVTAPGALPFKFGDTLQMNFSYSYRSSDPNKKDPDTLTTGVSTTLNFGGSSSVSGMMFFTSPQESGRVSLNATAPQQKGQEVRKGGLMVQEANLGLGKARLKLNYQNIDKEFAGFNSMRDSNAAAAEVINQLEKEKGIQRMGITGDVPLNAGSALSFSMNRIDDDNGEISSQSFAYNSGAFKFDFSMREVDSGFKRFNDIRESDRAQMAAEVGMKRTNIGMQFRTGMTADSKPVWSGFSMVDLQSNNGSLSYKYGDFNIGRVKIYADVRTMDSAFNRMAALNDTERTRMALIARRQFDPGAQANNVSDEDKKQILNEAGLDRRTFVADWGSGWLSFFNIDDNKGELSGSGIGLTFKQGSAYFRHHSIDPTFNRISSLQPIEKKHFGNEIGMTRTNFEGTLKFAGGEASFGHGSVVDHQGAAVIRQSLDFKNSRFEFHGNFQDIDAEFSRIMDLSDADRQSMLKERGFSRKDFTLKFQATKNINVESYVYDSTNTTADQTKTHQTHKINYTPQAGPKITAFTDSSSYYGEDGNLSSYSRRKITFDNNFRFFGSGLMFRSLSDVYTRWEADGEPVTSTTDQYRIETDPKKKSSFVFDMLNIDYGDGNTEDTTAFSYKNQISKKFSLTSSYSNISRTSGKSETNGAFGIDWAIRDNLKLGLSINNRDGGAKGSQQAQVFSLNGLLAKKFLCFNDINVGSGINSTTLTGRKIAQDNALKIEAGFYGGKILLDNTDKLNPKNGIYYASRLFQFETDKDPKKWYHLTFSSQDLTTPNGEPASKRNVAFDVKISPKTNLTYSSYNGKDGKDGIVIPIGGTVFKVNHVLGNKMTMFADYTNDLNEDIQRRARVLGFGIAGTLSNSAKFEFYYGISKLLERGSTENDNVFRFKYDHKISPDHFISISAQKFSGVEKTKINPFEGDFVARVEFRTTFN